MRQKDYNVPVIKVMEIDCSQSILVVSSGSKAKDVNGLYDFDESNLKEETSDPNKIF